MALLCDGAAVHGSSNLKVKLTTYFHRRPKNLALEYQINKPYSNLTLVASGGAFINTLLS